MRIIWQAIALLILIKPVIPVLDYVLNYEYISTQLCVNRDKPQLQCNGKCYLMQALAEQATQDKDANKKSTLKLDERTLLFHQEYVLSWRPLTMTLPWQRPVDTYCLNYRFLYSSEQYRPPIV